MFNLIKINISIFARGYKHFSLAPLQSENGDLAHLVHSTGSSYPLCAWPEDILHLNHTIWPVHIHSTANWHILPSHYLQSKLSRFIEAVRHPINRSTAVINTDETSGAFTVLLCSETGDLFKVNLHKSLCDHNA